MKSNSLRIARFRQMIALEERRAALQQQLDALTAQLLALNDQLVSEGPTASSTTDSPDASRGRRSSPGARTTRGSLKEKIMAALESAGSRGIVVKDLAPKLSIKPVNIHSWFHSTGTRNPAIRKLSPGHYRLEATSRESSGASRSQAQTIQPKTGQGGKKTGRQSGRGELSSRIMQQLQSAGAKGITVREIAERIGSKRKNIYIWFATTGKNFGQIRKIGTGQYKVIRNA